MGDRPQVPAHQTYHIYYPKNQHTRTIELKRSINTRDRVN